VAASIAGPSSTSPSSFTRSHWTVRATASMYDDRVSTRTPSTSSTIVSGAAVVTGQ
jgi:hypothetical protein